MEHLVLLFVRLILSLDQRSLWSLQRCIPDFRQVLSAPADTFQRRQIEIGPWQRYATRFLVLPVLIVAAAYLSLIVANLISNHDLIIGALIGCLDVIIVTFAG